jgi:hypothetical protein
MISDILWGALCGAVLMYAFAPSVKRLERGNHHLTEAELDEMIEETFPASDPPSY